MTVDHPRVLRRLAGVVVGVPDPDVTARFLAGGLGFTTRSVDGRLEALCAGDYGEHRPQTALTILKRDSLELIELRFDLEPSVDPERLGAAITDLGGALTRDDAGNVRFVDPTGIPVACSPAPADEGDALPPSAVRPRRLGHANLKVTDMGACTRFWVRAMGMWLSEQIGDDLAFMRYGAEHHNLGLRRAPQTTLHHLGFEIPGWESYRVILDHLDAAGFGAEFGPGRHAVGRNLFTYLVEPSSGLRVELFCDMARVDGQDDPETPPIRWRSEDRMTRTLNVWGSAPPPPSFLQ